jgi:hypothetical protein
MTHYLSGNSGSLREVTNVPLWDHKLMARRHGVEGCNQKRLAVGGFDLIVGVATSDATKDAIQTKHYNPLSSSSMAIHSAHITPTRRYVLGLIRNLIGTPP